MSMKNTGIDLEREKQEQDGTEWEFGASSPVCIASNIPIGERIKYLPEGEVQKGRSDYMDCATRGPGNILETKFNYLIANKLIAPEKIAFLKDKGYLNKKGKVEFSDRFNAIKSGTTKRGNSLKAPIHSMHTDGLIPKAMLPANKNMTWEDYHNVFDITNEMEELGKEFLTHFTINYDKVYIQEFPDSIQEELIDVVVYAWPKPVNGEYPKTDKDENHVVVYFATPRYLIFDNYLDEGKEGDFIKKLADDYLLYMYGYRLIIGESVEAQKISIMLKIIEAMKALIGILSKRVGAWLPF